MTFEEIIKANYTQGEADSAMALQIAAHVATVATVSGFRETDPFLARAARERAEELFGEAV